MISLKVKLVAPRCAECEKKQQGWVIDHPAMENKFISYDCRSESEAIEQYLSLLENKEVHDQLMSCSEVAECDDFKGGETLFKAPSTEASSKYELVVEGVVSRPLGYANTLAWVTRWRRLVAYVRLAWRKFIG